MKPHFNKRYTLIAKYCVFVMLACIFAIYVFLHFGVFVGFLWNAISVLSPILIGSMLAYVFSPLVGFFEKRVYHGLDSKKKYRLKRVLSVVSTFAIIITFLILLVLRLIPSVLRGYADLMEMSNFYLDTLKEWLLGLSLGEDHVLSGYVETLIGYVIGLLDSIYGVFGQITPDIASLAGTLVSILGDVILGIILSIYFLFSKERILAQFKKTARAFLSRRKFGAFCRSVRVTNDKFGGFLKGQLADALIIGMLSYICLSIIGVPYYPLVSVFVGMSAFIPLFGLTIGTIIGAVIVLLADPLDALWFVIFMICLNLVNKHMIRPKIVRTMVDASSVFMLTAIILMTGIVGFWGLVFGVPVFAVLYAFIHSFVNRRLEKRGLSTDPYEYYATEAGKELYIEREMKKARRKRLGGHLDATEEIFALQEDEEEHSLQNSIEPSTIEFETFRGE
jgi:predicted PurR-regulated permease PerM